MHKSMQDVHTTAHELINDDLMLDILSKVSFKYQCYSNPLKCTAQFSTDKGNHVEQENTESTVSINSAYVGKIISSNLPGIGDVFKFSLPTPKILGALYMDFWLCPSLLHAVVAHTEHLIITTDNAILTLTAEAYAGANALEFHGESNMKSIPSHASLFSNLFSVGILEETDGGAAWNANP